MPLSSGTRLGPYEIVAPLGAGGMGEVYRAKDTRLDRTVAIKILPTHLSSDPLLRQRFEREARAVSGLNHPHICVLHDVGSQDGTDFIVMEYLDGESLAQRLEKGPLPVEQVLKYGIQIADALDKAHRQGVVHRDLKPGNVMLTASGAKLLDFGLAKSTAPVGPGSSMTAAPTMTSPVTQHGAVVGTFQYMSPEQVEGREVDGRSDLFSFGTTLYEMVTGQRAFQGKSSISVASAILDREPEPIEKLAPLTPPALDRTIRKCLAKDPEDRWQTARDLLLELKWIAEAGSQAGVPVVVSTRRRITERVWMAASALLLVAAATLGGLYYRNATQPRPVIHGFILPPEKTTFRTGGGLTTAPAEVSPDGRTIVFGGVREDGVQLLYVRTLDTAVARPLTGTEGGNMPFWSPDSRKIGFFADGKLKKIEVAGGPPITLCDTSTPPRGGTWSPKGVIVFAPSVNGALQQVSEQGGQPAPATQFDTSLGELSHRWPYFLPDGKHFLYFARIGAPASLTTSQNNGVKVGSLENSTDSKFLLRVQIHAAYAGGYLFFMREATLMVQPFDSDRLEFSGEATPIAEQVQRDAGSARGMFSVSGQGVLAYHTGEVLGGSLLLWYDGAGKQIATLGDQATYLDAVLSPDKRKVAVSLVDPTVGPPDIWIYDVARQLRTRFTFDPAPDRWPVWSPDGTRVVFSSARKGHFDLYIKSYTGSGNEEILLETENDKQPRSWSRDGRYVLFTSLDPKNRTDVWALPLFGDRKPFPLVQTSYAEDDAAFSPDGKWIAYRSDESGRFEVFVTSFPNPGRKWQISREGGTQPRWMESGKEIVYLAPADRLMATAVDARGDTFDVGKARPLFAIRPSRPGNLYDAHDAQHLLVNSVSHVQSGAPLNFVVNWPAELRKK